MCYQSVKQMQLHPEVEKIEKRTVFVSLLKKMMCVNPDSRITPTQALTHFFITRSQQGDQVSIQTAGDQHNAGTISSLLMNTHDAISIM